MPTFPIRLSGPFAGCKIFDCGRAWAIIENLRVNGKPVQMHEHNRLPLYLIQPFNAKLCRTIIEDRDGNVIEVQDDNG